MIYTAYMWFLIVCATAFFGTALLICIPFGGKKGRVYRAMSVGWGKCIVKMSGCPLTVTGAEKVDLARPYICMSNHQSYFDVICLAAYLPNQIKFVAKKELTHLPIFGQALKYSDHVIVDRSKHADAVAELQKAADKIKSGTSILVFPEGTRSPDHKLGEFKKGGFMLALESGVPILPVSVSGTGPMMPKDGFTFKRGNIKIAIGDPIPTDRHTLETREELMDAVRAAIIRGFPEGSAEAVANREDSSVGS